MTKTETQWGVRLPDGRVEGPIAAREAAEGYMTPREYALRRAAATGGKVVCRAVTTVVEDWK